MWILPGNVFEYLQEEILFTLVVLYIYEDKLINGMKQLGFFGFKCEDYQENMLLIGFNGTS